MNIIKEKRFVLFFLAVSAMIAISACTNGSNSPSVSNNTLPPVQEGTHDPTQSSSGGTLEPSQNAAETHVANTDNDLDGMNPSDGEIHAQDANTQDANTQDANTQDTNTQPEPISAERNNIPVENVSLGFNAKAMLRGENLALNPTISPSDATDNNITYKTDNPNVVTVSDSGVLNAVGAGTAKITATASNGVTVSVEVTVVVPVESVSFVEPSKTINRYDYVTLNPTILPTDATDKSLTYKTDNQNIVTVSNEGSVYAVGAGTATVTCTASNGIQTTCEITVIVPVTSISVESDRNRFKIGETAGFKVTVYPEDATDKSYTISISGSGGSLSENNAVLCSSSGTTTITATASNGVSGKRDIEIFDMNELAAEVVRLTNIERANQGLSALSGSNSLLNSAAMTRAVEIITNYSHTRPNGSSCFTVFDDVGLSYGAAGENIYSTPASPQAEVSGWMNSEGHKSNILNSNYKSIGVGVAMDSNGTLHWVQMFIG